MRKLSLIAFAACLLAACTGNVKESAKSVLVGNYGEEITDDNAISTKEMLSLLEEQDAVTVKVEGEISATCAMKGCWMNLHSSSDEDMSEMMVRFKDYGFFVPKDIRILIGGPRHLSC